MYTPTTEEEADIRNLIKVAVFAQNEPMPLEYKAELANKALYSFDRWVATERNRVAELAIAKERKRIMVSILANVHKTVDAARRGDNPIDMTWLYEELMKEDK